MSVAWFNGALVSNKISLETSDRGLTLGDGVFETIAVHTARAIWLDEHVERMANAAVELGLGFDENLVRAGVAAVLARSTSATEVLRITLTRGVVTPRALTGYGAHPNLLITLSPIAQSASPETISLAVSKIRRNETAPSSRLKTLSYIDAIAAAREVMTRADDALMLNTAGNVASTTIGNLFLLKANELVTPSVDQGILGGITRAKILHHARSLGLKPRECIVSLSDVLSADAVFRSNSLRLVTPVSKLDGRDLGTRSVQFIRDLIVSLQEK